MVKLQPNEYGRVQPLIGAQNELSVFSVLHGLMPGEVWADDAHHPQAALIKTCECNYLAGDPCNGPVSKGLRHILDFWDSVTPDTPDWNEHIPGMHPNPHIRLYARRRYLLHACDWKPPVTAPHPTQAVIPQQLRAEKPAGADRVLAWSGNWGSDENFLAHGAGFYVREGNRLAGWSMADCYDGDHIAIGLYIDEAYRKRGIGLAVSAACAARCIGMGYRKLDWLCTDRNRGSQATARKLGFVYQNHYDAYSGYPPYENIGDLTAEEWCAWGEYLAKTGEPRLFHEAVHALIKGDDPEQAVHMLESMRDAAVQAASVTNEGLTRYRVYVEGLIANGHCKAFEDHAGWRRLVTGTR